MKKDLEEILENRRLLKKQLEIETNENTVKEINKNLYIINMEIFKNFGLFFIEPFTDEQVENIIFVRKRNGVYN